MIWWQGKQWEKWESINKLFSCVSTLVLTITFATQKNLFCHQWILTRLCEEKLSSFLKNATKLNFFCINSSLQKYASTGSKYLCALHVSLISSSVTTPSWPSTVILCLVTPRCTGLASTATWTWSSCWPETTGSRSTSSPTAGTPPSTWHANTDTKTFSSEY